ncbi:outer membrane beta-barrel protein [Sphingomonas sp.]|uniref:outer membrane beta-barrel protein n=1 Tax=Sphingomonas sp. TaxID=28214 RepID=UPI0031D92A24
MMFRRTNMAALALWGGLSALPSAAAAQTITASVFDTIVPFDYNRGRNESVLDRPRTAFDPIGLKAGSFTVLPSLATSVGFNSNVYQVPTEKTSDGFVLIAPSVRAVSDWSVHSLSVDASAGLKRFSSAAPRNEDAWSLGTDGRIDVDADDFLSLGVRTSRIYESQFSGASLNNIRSSVPAQVTTFRGSSESRLSRVRLVFSGDHSVFDYQPVTNFSNVVIAQTDRNRDITRAIGHVEYGLMPDAGLFVQVVGVRTHYKTPLATGAPNRNSRDLRILTGISLDISALVRGSVGVGYTDRNYDSPVYRNIGGLSVNARLEYFPSKMTTVSLAARREVEDAVIATTSGYFNNGVTLRIDHELLRNLLLNAAVDYERDVFIGIDGRATILRTTGGARYMVNNLIGLDASVGYSRRSSNSVATGPSLDEMRGLLGIIIHR